MSTALQRLNRPVIAILAVTAIAGALRFTHLSRPPELFFDENYYAKAGCILIGDSDHVCRVDSSDEHYWREHKWDVGSWVHPPLGKWTIGMGEKLFGVTPFGWRFSSAVAGTLTVTLVAVIAQLLFGSALWTFVAGLLLAVENLNVVLSRSALLDIHLEFWVVVGFLLLLLDRRWIDRRTPPEPEPEPERVSVGATGRHPGDGADGGRSRTLDDPLPALATVALRRRYRARRLVLREVVGRHGDRGSADPVRGVGDDEATSGRRLTRTGAGAGDPPGEPWPVRRVRDRPDRRLHDRVPAVVQPFRMEPEGLVGEPDGDARVPPEPEDHGARRRDQHVHADAPVLLARMDVAVHVATGQLLLARLRRGHRAGARHREPGDLLGQPVGDPLRRGDVEAPRRLARGIHRDAAAAQYLPWFLVTRPQFFFYVAPITPFMVLAITYVLRDLAGATIVLREPDGGTVESSRHPYLPFVWGYVLVAVGLFLWFWPVLTGNPISRTAWQARVWFRGWV